MSSSPFASPYIRRVAIAVGIAALVLSALYLLHSITRVFLLVFAGILLAVFLTGLGEYVRHRTPLSRQWALTAVVFGLLILLAGIGLLAGPRLTGQFDQLAQRLPNAISQLQANIKKLPWGQELLSQAPQPKEMISGSGSLVGRVTGFFSTTLEALTNTVVVLIVGLYLAADPKTYAQGLLRLVPPDRRERGRNLLKALGHALRWWLVGRFSSMGVVGIFTTVGLFITGVPLALTLGLIAALFSFVPYIGPIASAVPAILVALTESPALAGWVVVIYAIVQFLESYLITPLIQERAVSLPPALLIIAQVLMGVVAGALGVLLATPLTVTFIVMVQVLYVEGVLGERVTVMGDS